MFEFVEPYAKAAILRKGQCKYIESFYIFSLETGGVELAKLPELFHDNKLDEGVANAGVP